MIEYLHHAAMAEAAGCVLYLKFKLVILGTASRVLQLNLAQADDMRVFSALGGLGRKGCGIV